MSDERSIFTQGEIEACLRRVMTPAEARELAAEMFAPTDGSVPGHAHVHLSEDLLDLLLVHSESTAARVAQVLGLTADEVEARREQLQRRYGTNGD